MTSENESGRRDMSGADVKTGTGIVIGTVIVAVTAVGLGIVNATGIVITPPPIAPTVGTLLAVEMSNKRGPAHPKTQPRR